MGKFSLRQGFWKKMIFCFVSVMIMGFSLSWLILADFGTDPCSVMNLGIADALGLTLGTWQLILNILLLILVLIFVRELIGPGTVFNMVLVGYSCDFFRYLWGRLQLTQMTENFIARVIIMVIMLGIFVVAAAIYMTVDIGVAPYDAIPMILHKRLKKAHFRLVRICWDVMAVMIGALLGSTVGIVTVLIAFVLGPVIEAVKPFITKMVLSESK